MKVSDLAELISITHRGGDAVEDCDAVFDTKDRGPYIQLLTGTQWHPHDPRPEEVHLADLQAIAYLPRYGGHACAYNVAEHCVRVARAIQNNGGSPRLALAGLLHDVHEAYPPGDVAAPLKRGNSLYAQACRELEAKAQHATLIALTDDPLFCNAAMVKEFDYVLLSTERRDLMVPSDVDWGPLPAPLPETIHPWTSETAWDRWLSMYVKLSTAVFGRVAA